MANKIETLQSDLRSIFGESFGSSNKPVKNLSEAVETGLSEAGMLQLKNREHLAKMRERATKLHQANEKSRIKKNMDDFHQYADAEGEKSAEKSRIKKNLDDFHKYADAEGEKSAQRPRPSKLGSAGSAGAQGSHGGGEGGGGGKHHPFKRSPNLGVGPGTPPGFPEVRGKVHHDQRKCWSCHCGNIYSKGCVCIGTGATKDCPRGHKKRVHIKYKYRQAYNDMYHAWRRKQGGQVTQRIADRGRSARGEK